MSRIQPQIITLKNEQTALIRSADQSDAAALIDLLREVVPEEFKQTVESEVKRIEAFDQPPGRVAMVAEIGGKIVGSLDIRNGEQPRLRHRGVLGVFVAGPFREIGLGTALVRLALDWATRDTLIEKVSLEVLANNRGAITLYRRMGFVEQGRLPRETRLGAEEYVDNILMFRFVK